MRNLGTGVLVMCLHASKIRNMEGAEEVLQGVARYVLATYNYWNTALFQRLKTLSLHPLAPTKATKRKKQPIYDT